MPRVSQNYDIMVEIFPENEKDRRTIAYITDIMTRGVPISEGSRFRYMRDPGERSLYIGGFAYYNQGSGVTM